MAPRKAPALETAVLGLLLETPLHGYELRKRLNLLLGWTRVFSYGSLYPALKRMMRAGWIEEMEAPGPGVTRRRRIVYQVTDAGLAYFTSEITDAGPDAWEDESFKIRFAFFSQTEPSVRLRVLEGRRARLEERLAKAQHGTRHGGSDRYVTELHRHSIESVEREVHWLSELIDAERRAQEDRSSEPQPGAPSQSTDPHPSQPQSSKKPLEPGLTHPATEPQSVD